MPLDKANPLSRAHVNTAPFACVEDVVYAVAARAKELCDMRMLVLRKVAEGFDGDIDKASRGQLIESVLIEDFLDVVIQPPSDE